MPGDVNQSNAVDGSDQSAVFGTGLLINNVGAFGIYTIFRDINGDAAVNVADQQGVQRRVGSTFIS